MEKIGNQSLMSSIPPVSQIVDAIRRHISPDKIATTLLEALDAEVAKYNRETGSVIQPDYQSRLTAVKLASQLGYSVDSDVTIETELKDFMRVIVNKGKQP